MSDGYCSYSKSDTCPAADKGSRECARTVCPGYEHTLQRCKTCAPYTPACRQCHARKP